MFYIDLTENPTNSPAGFKNSEGSTRFQSEFVFPLERGHLSLFGLIMPDLMKKRATLFLLIN
jgi:hypothetical protein